MATRAMLTGIRHLCTALDRHAVPLRLTHLTHRCSGLTPRQPQPRSEAATLYSSPAKYPVHRPITQSHTRDSMRLAPLKYLHLRLTLLRSHRRRLFRPSSSQGQEIPKRRMNLTRRAARSPLRLAGRVWISSTPHFAVLRTRVVSTPTIPLRRPRHAVRSALPSPLGPITPARSPTPFSF
ncbi:hypothetical protein L227DRAFT_154025 [Lentinus tigrinus ALCF2SS1-6]|uniref:Uncharacterized protein n=1 Tax=Lentinus tigrinus ALCF2SS1-6 TaxID=1328759 RepID=A0A5C2S8Y0_9APHY|nr:hypothetical protein L227DRAFT_154025 [Lentinus tigrinus ALCF2SS1-6]